MHIGKFSRAKPLKPRQKIASPPNKVTGTT